MLGIGVRSESWLAKEAGVEDVLTGVEDLAAAEELEEASQETLAAGAAEVPAGMDDLAAADWVAFLSGVVAGAGVADLAEGLSNEKIAHQLVISSATARHHVSACISKLGAANCTQAAVLAVKYKLI